MRYFEFSTATIAHTHRQLFIGGRVYKGIIQIGDCFSKLQCRSSISDETVSSVIPVQLRVVRINTYRRDVNQLHEAMTGGIELTGDLHIQLGPLDVLMGKSDAALQEFVTLAETSEMPFLSV